MATKIILLLTFFALMLGVGFYCRRHATNVNGFVLGGRSVGPWLTAFAYGTTYFSAVIFVGYAGQFGWKYGLSATWIGLGNALLGSLLAWVVLGRRTRLLTHHFDSATMPEFFGRRYESPSLKLGASAIIFIFLIPYTASLYNGLSRLFGMAFGIDYTFCIVIMAVLTGIYVIAGGYMATAVNDFIQGLIMLGGIVAVIAAVLKSGGGFMASVASLAKITEDAAASQPGVFASFFGPDPLNLLGVIILTSMGTWGLPQMTQKFYAIKSEKAIDKGTVISTLFATVIAGGCYFLGGFGRVFYQNPNVGGAPSYDAIIPSMISTLSPFLIGIVVVLVLSASMSTLSSLVMASASTLTLDFIRGTVRKDMDEKKQLLTIRVMIVVFIALSVVLAILQYKIGFAFIAQLMGISWGALAGSFLAPFLYGLYWRKATKAACWVNFIFASGLMILNMFFRSSFPVLLQSPINAGAFAMVAGLLIVPLVSAFTKAPDASLVNAAFDSYERPVTVSAKQALGE
jgi:SSS family transporter